MKDTLTRVEVSLPRCTCGGHQTHEVYATVVSGRMVRTFYACDACGRQVADGWTVLGGEGTGAYAFTAVDRALMS
jgi:hypothetical protein